MIQPSNPVGSQWSMYPAIFNSSSSSLAAHSHPHAPSDVAAARHPAPIPAFPVVKGRSTDTVLTAQLRRLHAGVGFLENRNDLLFTEPRLLHSSSPTGKLYSHLVLIVRGLHVHALVERSRCFVGTRSSGQHQLCISRIPENSILSHSRAVVRCVHQCRAKQFTNCACV